ncbi:MAG: hypothetical protein HUU20_14500 [Pirellulales bacterium]|nr:hypothetical protein [Pirellulales bacterium]
MIDRRAVLLSIALASWPFAGHVGGQQVRHLPEVLPPSEAYAGQQLEFVESPDGRVLAPIVPAQPGGVIYEPAQPLIAAPLEPGAPATETPRLSLEPAPPPNPDRPPDARDGMFQKLTFSETWLAGGQGADALGMNDLELKMVLALPVPSRTFPMVITPGFVAHYLEGPRVSDLPPRVYEAYTQFRWFRRYTPRWASDLAVSPGLFTDFERGSDDALRITGHGAAIFDWTATTRIVFGVGYLDRENLGVLPIGGVIWKPNPDWEFKLVAPRPEIGRRVYWSGFVGDRIQDWLYVAGEFGGGTWAIVRADGTPDTFTYDDYRALLGLKRKAIGTPDGWVEIGYIFGRQIEYQSGTPEVEPSDTVLVRAGVTY